MLWLTAVSHTVDNHTCMIMPSKAVFLLLRVPTSMATALPIIETNTQQSNGPQKLLFTLRFIRF